ncbi:MAG: hypothetical protein K8R79_08425 [Calditrichales bacterium]|nr:hypothetical protein [Calditrichales bacterium]
MNQLNKLVFGAAIILISTFLFAQDSAKVEVFKLTDNLYKLTLTTNFSVNMVASIGSDGVLLVDDGTA